MGCGSDSFPKPSKLDLSKDLRLNGNRLEEKEKDLLSMKKNDRDAKLKGAYESLLGSKYGEDPFDAAIKELENQGAERVKKSAVGDEKDESPENEKKSPPKNLKKKRTRDDRIAELEAKEAKGESKETALHDDATKRKTPDA